MLDPLGQRPDPTSFGEMLEKVIDARIDARWKGQQDARLDGVSDAKLVLELIARGFAVHKPLDNT